MARQRMARAAGLLLLAMMISRILGYVRDVLISARFGQNQLTDAYNAAFSIPDLLYLLLVGGVLSSAFIPVFTGYLSNDNEEEAWEVASIVFNLVVLLMLLGVGLGIAFAPQLIRLLVPGFDSATLQLTVTLTRIMFFQAFFMALSGVAMGILQSYQYFVATAMSAVIYNLSIILVGWFLSPYLGIQAFSLGVLVGAVLSFVVQVPPLLRHGLRYRFSLNFAHPGIRRLWHLMLPMLISLSVTQFNLFVNQHLASGLSFGKVSALRFAERLVQLPVGTFAGAIAVASFPGLATQVAQGKFDDYKNSFTLSLRYMIFLMLPCFVGLATLGMPIVRFLYQKGEFTPEATQATAYALLYYSFGVVALGCLQLLNRAFYAIQDTKTPMVTGVLTIGLNIWLNIVMVRHWGHGGLALAYSISSTFNMILLLILLRRRIGRLGGRRLALSAGKTLLASALAGVSVLMLSARMESIAVLSKIGQLEQVGACIAVAVAVFVLAALALRMEELGPVWEIVRRRLGR